MRECDVSCFGSRQLMDVYSYGYMKDHSFRPRHASH